ncbi:MAG: RHS repeat-associated core domain-containing protein, partial [Caldilineaceae bacterium]|nr:RHS repeat-associated core domain-containing protein [Caldilineaceae bacterium]
GQKVDVTGLHYYNARYFDDHIGQFVSPDSMVPDASNLISWNRFAYAADNPLRYSDPTGHDIWDALTTVVDFAQGVGAQVGYNNTSLIPAQIHSQAPQAGESAAMQTGRFVGNVVSMVQGVAEVTFGAGVDAGGGGLCLTGVGCLAGAPAIVAGTAVIAHGGATATSGAVGAGQQLGNLYNSVMGEDSGSANRQTGSDLGLVYESSPKHHPNAQQGIGNAPQDGQGALDNSLQVTGNSPRRVGVDRANNQFVVFDQTREGIFHGHVRSWQQLTDQMKNTVRNAGYVNWRGLIK